ncbi:hypothetical protein ACHAWX_000784 [Stephanocyclus meneghinianus]
MIQINQQNESCASLRDRSICIFCTSLENLRKKSYLKLLHWMRSKLAIHVDMPYLEVFNPISLHLAKIPEDYMVGGNKGFSGIEWSLPKIMMQIHCRTR